MLAVLPLNILAMMQVKDLHLVFEEDFRKSHSAISRNWNFDNGPVYNNELETYVGAEGGNVIHNSKGLTIRATKVGDRIFSGRLTSKQSWQYGYFEVSAKMNNGKGTWPAIWMLGESIRTKDASKSLPWPKCGEIDIMEQVGFDPLNVHFTLHSENNNFMNHKERQITFPVATATSEFHRYGLDWTKDHLDFYIDGKRMGGFARPANPSISDWPFDAKFFFILNLAIGGNWGGAKGVDQNIFPCDFQIQYVRVYQKRAS